MSLSEDAGHSVRSVRSNTVRRSKLTVRHPRTVGGGGGGGGGGMSHDCHLGVMWNMSCDYIKLCKVVHMCKVVMSCD